MLILVYEVRLGKEILAKKARKKGFLRGRAPILAPGVTVTGRPSTKSFLVCFLGAIGRGREEGLVYVA